jgi:hypothetical protein
MIRHNKYKNQCYCQLVYKLCVKTTFQNIIRFVTPYSTDILTTTFQSFSCVFRKTIGLPYTGTLVAVWYPYEQFQVLLNVVKSRSKDLKATASKQNTSTTRNVDNFCYTLLPLLRIRIGGKFLFNSVRCLIPVPIYCRS